jgi:hypothetical protein
MQRGVIMKTETIVITSASDKAGGIYMNQDRVIAYFSMEIALRPDIPTYSRGSALAALCPGGDRLGNRGGFTKHGGRV